MISKVRLTKTVDAAVKAASKPTKPAKVARTGHAVLSTDEFFGLLSPHLDGLYGTALRLSRSPAAAEELVQDTTTKAYTHLSSFEKGTNFHAWIYRILMNTFLSEQRLVKRAPHALGDDAQVAAPSSPPQPRPEEWPQASEDVAEELKRAVDELPEIFRIPLLLATLGGMAYNEISDVLHVPVGTVMSRIHRARTRLRKDLKSFGRDRGLTGKRFAPASLN